MGRVHSIETFGAVDGPGIRFVIFLQGCPMRCAYCHNPDTWAMQGGNEMSVTELVQEVKKYKNYFGNNGGVTVSGGEPLIQIDFVTELFKTLKLEGIHTCIDTSGAIFNREKAVVKKFDELMKYTDLVLLDLKHIDTNKHQKLTTFHNDNILDFAKYLDSHNIPMWIRHVLVPGINDDVESLSNLADFIKTLNNVQNIEILPYHTMGIAKYKELGLQYPLEGVESPSKESIEVANRILKGDNK